MLSVANLERDGRHLPRNGLSFASLVNEVHPDRLPVGFSWHSGSRVDSLKREPIDLGQAHENLAPQLHGLLEEHHVVRAGRKVVGLEGGERCLRDEAAIVDGPRQESP